MGLDIPRTRDCLFNFDFSNLFVEELGWSRSSNNQPTTEIFEETPLEIRRIAELGGVVVLEVRSLVGPIPDARIRAAIHKKISELHHENLILFLDKERTQSLWYWVKREDGKRQPREHIYMKGQPGDLFLSKLTSMVFEISELDQKGNAPVVEVANRLKEALDVEKVTKRFYTEFQQEHIDFLNLIQGIKDDKDRRWYASIILNRLMFIYFLQRKNFLNNGDSRYLQNKLEELKRSGKNHYFRNFLEVLFFEGFAKPEKDRTEQTKAILGDIKYLNGGLFLRHRIELQWTGIDISDKAFENLFKLFERYSWNLNDTPGGEDDEINPDVLGYIFEKYINQKAFGAYYTRTEITEYLCERTIHPLILERINDVIAPRGFESMAELLMNLDSRICRELVSILPQISILDPACGSGAFLVAAMKTLINIYTAILGKIEFLSDTNLKKWLADFRREHRSIGYGIKKRIVTDNIYGADVMEEACEIAKLRLFLAMVSSAQSVEELEPLPNIDFNIVCGNSLIGLMHVEDKEFEKRHAQGNLFVKSYRQVVEEKNRLVNMYRHTAEYAEDLRSLRDKIEELKADAQSTLNEILLQEFEKLKIKFEQAIWDDTKNKEGKSAKRSLKISDVEALQPLHWGYEFDEILNNRGGFDVIITNPPWEIFKPQAKEFFAEHNSLVTKNKMTIKEFEKEQAKLLKNTEVRKAWLEYESRFPHLSLYFRNSAQYKNQISIVDGKKAGTDINLYKLFLEQCYNLLRKEGHLGIVIPSGIYTDLGSKQLREMLFNQTKITGLFGFENRKAIFEGVDSRFKFVVLTIKRGGATQSFPTAFMRHHVEELDHFPQQRSIQISVDLIRRLSPDSLSIPEFNSQLDFKIATKFLKFPLLGETTKNGWFIKFENEFHMTNDSYLFETSPRAGSLPLYEGKMIHQFNHKLSTPRYWIPEKKARKAVLGKMPDTMQPLGYSYFRLVYRAIARNTDERTMICTVIPPNNFFGHSLNAIKPGPGTQDLCYLAGVLNSFVLDFCLRQRVSANVTMFYLYQLPIPRLENSDKRYTSIVIKVAQLICTEREFDDFAVGAGINSYRNSVNSPNERLKLRAELDGIIAHLYGLTDDEFAYILGAFPLVAPPVREAVLEAYRKLAPKTADQEIAALLKAGESQNVEFKSSARWDLKQNKLSKEIEQVIVKNVAAFMNTDGGALLIGVDDSGRLIGLENDFKTLGKRQNTDGFENFLVTLLADAFGKDAVQFFKISFHNVDGLSLCKLQVAPTPKAMFVPEANDERLYIRTGNSTRALTTKEAIDYCKNRWE